MIRRPLYKSSRSRKSYSRVSRRPSRRVLMQTKRYSRKKASERERIVWTSLGFLGILALIGSLIFLIWLQRLTNELPAVDKPPALASSIIYDRNGIELYRINSDTFERDWIKTDDYVPELQKWAFLAAEDEEFYNHGGVDFTAIIRCVIYQIFTDKSCGGSTISQQVIVNTLLTREYSYIRKIKEIVLALQLERLYDKDEIMNIYLNVVPQGSSVLGIKRGADFYFDKNLDELDLPEMIVLSAVVQNPTIMSPTIGSDTESNKERLFYRADYIIDQMVENIDRINERIELANEKNKDKEGFPQQEYVTVEELLAAKDEVRNLEYQKPTVDIKAPHFVFYVQKLLQEEVRGYNNGKPFTVSDIQTGGLKIYTTLDYSLQEVAEKYIEGSEYGQAGYYRNIYGASNSALMTMDPETGEILAMVGSKCYKNDEYISNCDELDETEGNRFDSDVNVLDTLQSPGSTNKALGYYLGFKSGVISSGSILPDVPINSIPGYRPKNWNGGYSGMGDVRSVLARSLNIPALFIIESVGIQNYIDSARQFGYTTYNNPSGYGPSIILGGADIKGIEHAQAFSVFANGGDFVEHEVILKITDIDGNEIYSHEPEKVNVADPAAIYIVNNILNPRTSGSIAPPKHMLDRDVAGKTGTSENNRDTWFVMWSPDFVTLGWMGNNDNTPMSGSAFGSTSVEPWVGSYMDAVSSAFPDKTPFVRPSGVVSSGGKCDDDSNGCIGELGLAVAGTNPPSYIKKEYHLVCIDQPNKLARDIDIASGYAIQKEFVELKSPVEKFQKDVDAYLLAKGYGAPYEECDIDRNINLNIPQAIVYSPQPGYSYLDSLNIHVKGIVGDGKEVSSIEVSLNDKKIGEQDGDEYSDTVDISNYSTGHATVTIEITDNKGKSSTSSVNIFIGEDTTKYGTLSLNVQNSANPYESVVVGVLYDGNKDVDEVTLYQSGGEGGVTTYVGEMRKLSNSKFEYRWVAPNAGTYTLYAVAEEDKLALSSNASTITITESLQEDTENGSEFFGDGG